MGRHHCGSGPADPRDPDDPTPRISRRQACGVLVGGVVAAAAWRPTDALAVERVRQELDDKAAAGGGFAEDDRAPHVVVIGMDGLRPDALDAATTPSFDRLLAMGTISRRGFAGGNPVVNEQVTSSGPGWSSICTGVWVDRHEVESNAFLTPNYVDFPHFYQRILELEPDAQLASIVNWEPINDIIVAGMAPEQSKKVLQARAWTPPKAPPEFRQRDREVGRMTAELIATGDPMVCFMHLDAVDNAGHSTEFSPDSPLYLEAIEANDAAVGDVLAAIDARPDRDRERWAFVLTTDHGGLGNGHGGQTIEERRIPFITAGDGVPVGEELHGPGHLAVPPTVLTYLGLPISEEWGWQADAFGLTA